MYVGDFLQLKIPHILHKKSLVVIDIFLPFIRSECCNNGESPFECRWYYPYFRACDR